MNNCKYYKCHDLLDEDFDCSLCYCPFYELCKEQKKYELFGGYILNNKILACEKCVYFHKKDNVKIYNELKKQNKTIQEMFDYFVTKEIKRGVRL